MSVRGGVTSSSAEHRCRSSGRLHRGEGSGSSSVGASDPCSAGDVWHDEVSGGYRRPELSTTFHLGAGCAGRDAHHHDGQHAGCDDECEDDDGCHPFLFVDWARFGPGGSAECCEGSKDADQQSEDGERRHLTPPSAVIVLFPHGPPHGHWLSPSTLPSERRKQCTLKNA